MGGNRNVAHVQFAAGQVGVTVGDGPETMLQIPADIVGIRFVVAEFGRPLATDANPFLVFEITLQGLQHLVHGDRSVIVNQLFHGRQGIDGRPQSDGIPKPWGDAAFERTLLDVDGLLKTKIVDSTDYLGSFIADMDMNIIHQDKNLANFFRFCGRTLPKRVDQILDKDRFASLLDSQDIENRLVLKTVLFNVKVNAFLTRMDQTHEQFVLCCYLFKRTSNGKIRLMDEYRKMRTKLEAIINASHDGIWITDAKGKLISTNRAAEKLYGFNRKKYIGKAVSELLKNGIVTSILTPEIVETKKTVSFITRAIRTNRTALITGTPAISRSGEITFVVFNERDLTELNNIKKRLEHLEKEKDKFQEELTDLLLSEAVGTKIVAASPQMQDVIRAANKISRFGVSGVLIQGASGTGKGILAKYMHNVGKRKKGPFIHINCAALPETLLEAELFGYEKGAFTGAHPKGKIGMFELAHNGTLFLDEIGELSKNVQSKLLKYLDDFEITPVGGTISKRVDCTLITATNRDLYGRVKSKKFRRDLYFRLSSLVVKIPPLKERKEDIVAISKKYCRELSEIHGKHINLNEDAQGLLYAYDFPGNVRELKNLIQAAAVFAEDGHIDRSQIENLLVSKNKIGPGDILQEVSIQGLRNYMMQIEHDIIKRSLKTYGSTRKAAQKLSISQSGLVRKLQRFSKIH